MLPQTDLFLLRHFLSHLDWPFSLFVWKVWCKSVLGKIQRGEGVQLRRGRGAVCANFKQEGVALPCLSVGEMPLIAWHLVLKEENLENEQEYFFTFYST